MLNNKGFTLVEMLIIMLIISSLTLLSLNKVTPINGDYYCFMNEYLLKQVDSFCHKERNNYDEYGLSFNEKGHVNIAKSINIDNHKVIIHLGNGYVSEG